VVTLRSLSVKTQNFVPFDILYTDRSRSPADPTVG
jgi:hypothetical protein